MKNEYYVLFKEVNRNWGSYVDVEAVCYDIDDLIDEIYKLDEDDIGIKIIEKETKKDTLEFLGEIHDEDIVEKYKEKFKELEDDDYILGLHTYYIENYIAENDEYEINNVLYDLLYVKCSIGTSYYHMCFENDEELKEFIIENILNIYEMDLLINLLDLENKKEIYNRLNEDGKARLLKLIEDEKEIKKIKGN